MTSFDLYVAVEVCRQKEDTRCVVFLELYLGALEAMVAEHLSGVHGHTLLVGS